MPRTKLADRTLPPYTRGEEIFNMVSHIVGGGFGVVALALCVVFAVLHRNWWGLAGGVVYGLTMIFLYTMSSVYHGLTQEKPKKVMQVLDHCTIYALILTLFILTATAIGVTFTAIDFHRYAAVAMSGYFVVGWCALFALKPIVQSFGWPLFLWLLAGGVVYTLGMIFYAFGRKKKFFHSVFHLFILGGSVLQFIGILLYCM